MEHFDRVDAEILAKLQVDGRMSNARLSAELAMSETPCWRRLKRLEESGIIECYQAVLNRRKIGLGLLSFVQIGCGKHDERTTLEFDAAVKANPRVLACHNVTGTADYLMIVVSRDLDEYSVFVERFIRSLPGVISITSNLSLREVKSSNIYPVDI